MILENKTIAITLQQCQDIVNNALPLIKTGIPLLDEKLGGGAEPEDFIVIGAHTGVGKSWISYKIAVNMANAGHKILYIETENKDKTISERLLMMGYKDNGNFILHTNKYIDPQGCLNLIEKVNPDVIFIDVFSGLFSEVEQFQMNKAYTSTIKYFKATKKIIFITEQVIKEQNKNKLERPTIDSIAGVKAITRLAEKVIVLWKPIHALQFSDDDEQLAWGLIKKAVEIRVVKCRVRSDNSHKPIVLHFNDGIYRQLDIMEKQVYVKLVLNYQTPQVKEGQQQKQQKQNGIIPLHKAKQHIERYKKED
jgi:archaellum biogenesis ATPase FlaH